MQQLVAFTAMTFIRWKRLPYPKHPLFLGARAKMATENWHLKGEYFENCNCEVLCPCVVPGPPTEPTVGHCDVAFAFHIHEGSFGELSLNGLNVVVVAYTPGKMGDGNWTTAVYIDERADRRQREALGKILSGDLGGPMRGWMSLTTDFKGIKYFPISYTSDGRTRRVVIPAIMDFNVEGIVGREGGEPLRLENVGHPVSSSLVLARGTSSTYTDHDMVWDNTGKNGHYADFDWHWP